MATPSVGHCNQLWAVVLYCRKFGVGYWSAVCTLRSPCTQHYNTHTSTFGVSISVEFSGTGGSHWPNIGGGIVGARRSSVPELAMSPASKLFVWSATVVGLAGSLKRTSITLSDLCAPNPAHATVVIGGHFGCVHPSRYRPTLRSCSTVCGTSCLARSLLQKTSDYLFSNSNLYTLFLCTHRRKTHCTFGASMSVRFVDTGDSCWTGSYQWWDLWVFSSICTWIGTVSALKQCFWL